MKYYIPRFATVSLKHGARKQQEGNPYPPKYLLVTSYLSLKETRVAVAHL